MLDGGRVLRSGPLETLTDAATVEVELLGDPDPVISRLRSAGATVGGDGTALYVTWNDGDPYNLVRDVLADTQTGMRRLGPRTTSLEDVFLAQEGAQR
jgi:hypothetical protein